MSRALINPMNPLFLNLDSQIIQIKLRKIQHEICNLFSKTRDIKSRRMDKRVSGMPEIRLSKYIYIYIYILKSGIWDQYL